jgi:hypothetical protein
MSAIWLLVLAVGVSPFQPSDPSAPSSTAQSAAATAPAPTGPEAMAISPAAPVVDPNARSPQQLRDAVAVALRQLNSAKLDDRTAAVASITDLYRELTRDRFLTQSERQRLVGRVRTRLQRFAAQLRYESTHANALAKASSAAESSKTYRTNQSQASLPAAGPPGAAGGPAAEGLDQLVDLIQMTLGGPDNWLPPQRAVNAVAGQGGAGFGAGAPGQNGNQVGGGGAGGLEQAAQVNGDALVDLIQKTIAPESWDINGGPGSIVYYGNFRALVVRQSEEGHSDVSNLLKVLGR